MTQNANRHQFALSDEDEAKLQAILSKNGWTLKMFIVVSIAKMFWEYSEYEPEDDED